METNVKVYAANNRAKHILLLIAIDLGIAMARMQHKPSLKHPRAHSQ